MEELRWAFELIDKISGNADKMTRSVARFEKEMVGGGKAIVTFEKQLKKTTGSTFDFLRAFSQMNMISGFSGPWGMAIGGIAKLGSAVTGIIGDVADLGYEFLKTGIKALAFKQNAIQAFTALSGGDEAEGGHIFRRALGFATYSPATDKEAVTSMKQIRALGYSQLASENIFAGLSDVVSRSGGSGSDLAGMMTQIAQAKAKGHFQMQDLRIIMEHGAGSGLSMESFYETIARKMGVGKATAAAMVSNGTIGADAGIDALLTTIENKVSGGKLGSVSLQAGTSYTGLMSTIESLPDRLWFNLADKSQGSAGIQKFMQTIIDTFDNVFGPEGKGNKLLQRFVDDVGSYLGSIDVNKLTGKLESFIDALTGMYDMAKEVAPGVEIALERLMDSLGGAKGAADAVWLLGKGLEFTLYSVEALVRLGSAVGTVFNVLSGHAFDSQPAAAWAASAVGTPARTKQVEQLAGGTNIEVHVNAPVDARGMDPSAVSRHLAEQLPAALDVAFDRMSTERGFDSSDGGISPTAIGDQD